jgi:hypothetical protein
MWSPKGRGVFALQSFQAGDVVEICPVIVFECPYDDLPAELQEYVFDWSDLDSSAGRICRRSRWAVLRRSRSWPRLS